MAERPNRASSWLAHRTTGDILLLLIAGTICSAVIFSGATVALVEIIHPASETGPVVNMIADVINTLIGLLAGFLAGRSDVQAVRSQTERTAQEARSGGDT